MGFADKFVSSVGSSNLRDDEFHHDTDALAAAALAGDIGALLCRVKYADGTINKLFEGNSGNLAQLLRIWEFEVRKKGEARGWIQVRSERDISTAYVLYRRVAQASLAHWLDGKCKECFGTGVGQKSLRACTACKGGGEAEITCSGGFERERILDMISELSEISTSHAGRANALLRHDPQY